MRVITYNLLIFLLLSMPTVSLARDINVGVYLSMTGPIAAWGKLEYQGITIAREMQPKIKGYHIRLTLEDADSKPEEAALAVENLLLKRTRYFIGPVTTSSALAALPILKKNNAIDVLPTANGASLTKIFSNAARVCLTNDSQAKIMANYIYTGGFRRGVVIRDVTQDYSIDLAKKFLEYFRKLGGKISMVYDVQFSQKDFSAIITNIKQQKPDFIYITTYYPTIALFLRQLRSFGLKTKVFAGSAASSYALIKIAPKSSDGLVFTDDFDPLIPQSKTAVQFIKLFKQKYHRTPDSPEALAADAYLLLMDGINRCGLNYKNLSKCIRNTTFYGITGKIILKNGYIRRTIILREVKDGSFIPIAVYQP